MVSMFCTLLVVSPLTTTQSQITTVLKKLDTIVSIEIDGTETSFDRTEAKRFINSWLKDLNQPQVIRSHPAKFNRNKDTYGLYHLKSINGDYRFFYFSKVKNNDHKIVRIKIIKV